MVIENDAPAQQLWRIDDLAQLTQVPTRTIRFYNTQGLLPPPLMRGRVAYYNQEHLLILGLIRDLKEQQRLPLDTIKQLLLIRAQHGEVQMNLVLKQRFLRSLTGGGPQVHLTTNQLAQQIGIEPSIINNLVEQNLLFPVEENGEPFFSGDDILLLELYLRLEKLGLPLALPSLIRFQLRQLTRSEIAACEQYLIPQWQQEGLPVEQQTLQFEEILTITDTLISLLHRKLLYQME